jgi:hypothetical protein
MKVWICFDDSCVNDIEVADRNLSAAEVLFFLPNLLKDQLGVVGMVILSLSNY